MIGPRWARPACCHKVEAQLADASQAALAPRYRLLSGTTWSFQPLRAVLLRPAPQLVPDLRHSPCPQAQMVCFTGPVPFATSMRDLQEISQMLFRISPPQSYILTAWWDSVLLSWLPMRRDLQPGPPHRHWGVSYSKTPGPRATTPGKMTVSGVRCGAASPAASPGPPPCLLSSVGGSPRPDSPPSLAHPPNPSVSQGALCMVKATRTGSPAEVLGAPGASSGCFCSPPGLRCSARAWRRVYSLWPGGSRPGSQLHWFFSPLPSVLLSSFSQCLCCSAHHQAW
ncbi:hypothetical protein NDU88_004438 [Pleurodeles waltl]|uniref:Uncharacterized protein n=1 Tax=Pleurodeles waltl TaxID=8319 RepID=A0AAV7TRC7_PLEWA|nr:hypothetical protein NDU88_004438 [Pleurodeles waltl]